MSPKKSKGASIFPLSKIAESPRAFSRMVKAWSKEFEEWNSVGK